MDFPVPPASANWHLGVPPEVVSLIEQRQRQWVIVQVPGYPPVIYANCLEGDHPVEVLQKHLPDDIWQEAPVTGGSGGGTVHPHGIILLGPEACSLEPFRAQLNEPAPPDCELKQSKDKLKHGTLRLFTPATYLKMCRAYKKKANTNKILRVVGPGPQPRKTLSVADFFQYHSHQVTLQQQQQEQGGGTASIPSDSDPTHMQASSRTMGNPADSKNVANTAGEQEQMEANGNSVAKRQREQPTSDELQRKLQAWARASQDADAAERSATAVQEKAQQCIAAKRDAEAELLCCVQGQEGNTPRVKAEDV